MEVIRHTDVSRKFTRTANKTKMKSIVQHLREEKNLTQTELSEKSGLSLRTIQRIITAFSAFYISIIINYLSEIIGSYCKRYMFK